MKQHLHQRIEAITDEATLQDISTYLDSYFQGEKFAWNSLPESVKESIEASLYQADTGKQYLMKK